jgi:hypothetical protein
MFSIIWVIFGLPNWAVFPKTFLSHGFLRTSKHNLFEAKKGSLKDQRGCEGQREGEDDDPDEDLQLKQGDQMSL